MTSIRFYFCNEVGAYLVYPPDLDFIFSVFLDLKKYFLLTFL